ncbi:MAG: type II toxin-antitoxin system HicA family toxin [Bacteroidales bacterium]|nr:type II toxin-antitoxin system HicA family toxin [Bacteroidales bacterium]
MGTKDKLVARLKSLPSDFRFDEAVSLLNSIGYHMENKGKTSGSRVMFIDGKNRKILLHRPHPGNHLKQYAVKNLLDKLIRNEDI